MSTASLWPNTLRGVSRATSSSTISTPTSTTISCPICASFPVVNTHGTTTTRFGDSERKCAACGLNCGKPSLADLFSGAGGACRGYQKAGFCVLGVDVAPQPHYVGCRLVQADALEVDISGFDAIHASPPCPGYTTMNNRRGSSAPKLIAEVRDLLEATGLPWIMENVPGALADMRSPIELTGEMFGLGVHRPRLFESNVMLLAPPRPPRQANPKAVYGKNDGRRLWTRKDGSELRCASLEEAREAMGMPWADWQGVKDAIPPAYTEFIGAQLLTHTERVHA